jgi:DNA-binding MarR family transcriptional regulator
MKLDKDSILLQSNHFRITLNFIKVYSFIESHPQCAVLEIMKNLKIPQTTLYSIIDELIRLQYIKRITSVRKSRYAKNGYDTTGKKMIL